MRVLVLGTGQMGSAIIRDVVATWDLDLVGVVARRPERSGLDAATAAGLDGAIGVLVEHDLTAALAQARPQVAIQATCSTLEDATPEIEACLRHGVDVVSIAEEVVWPAAYSPAWAQEIHELAVAHGATVVGTGVNPGFVLDVLAVTLTNVCRRVDSIVASRSNDLSPYGPTVLRSQGVGLTPDAFRAGVERGEVVGHIGFPASIGLIAASLGWEIERVEETREPIISGVARTTSFVEVAPGEVAGCLHTAVAYRDERPVITLVHPQQVHPGAEGTPTEDRIEIHGEPHLRWTGAPEIPGGVATAALAVHLVDRVAAAPAGLTSMLHLPPARRRTPTAPRRHVPAGTRVELHRVLLPPGERARSVPEETQRVPLELRVRGTLVDAARLGDEATIVTSVGRRHRGTLVDVDPSDAHGFGPAIPELAAIGEELRTLLRRGQTS